MHDQMHKIVADDFAPALVLAAKAGNKAAYGRLVKLYQSPVRSFLRQLTQQNLALADDLAQEAFFRGYRKLDGYRGDASFKSWIIGIAYNLFLQHIRKEKRRSELGMVAIDTETIILSSSHDDRLDIESALSHLTLDQRTAICLWYQQDMSHAEISSVMQQPLGTIKSHIKRGRETLKILLSQTKRQGNSND